MLFDWTTKLRRPRLFGVLLLLPLVAAASIAVRAQYQIKAWTTDDGLPQNTVSSIVQTPDGYIWFATLDGLVRFDGVRFKIFNHANSPELKTNRLRDVYAGDNGELWITTENSGLIRYQSGEFKTFTVADGLPADDVIAVRPNADGETVFATTKGSAKTEANRIVALDARDFRRFRQLFGARSDSLWEINDDGLFQTSRDELSTRRPLPFQKKLPVYDTFYNFDNLVKLFEDSRGALWISAERCLYRLQNNRFKTFDQAENRMPASLVKAIAEDGDGNIWIGTETDGACRLSRDERFVCYNAAAGLSSNHVTNFLLDREQTLWIGTKDNGINRLAKQIINPLSLAEGLPDKNVYPILQDRAGNFWIGSFSSLTKYANGKPTVYTRGRGIFYEIVQSLFEDRDGGVWVGSVGGVQRLSGERLIDFTETLGFAIGEADFWDIHQTKDGAIWFATSDGVARYKNDRAEHLTARDRLPADDVKVLHEAADGSLWLGTTGGAARLSKELVVAAELKRAAQKMPDALRVLTARDGLAGDYIRSIYEDDAGAIWFGTYDSGLTRFKNNGFSTINSANGLFSDGVFAILPDARGNFWMSSNQGIYRVAQQELNDFADNRINSIVSIAFDKSDGMLSTECNGGRQPAGIKAGDGKLWFPTQNGVAVVDPEAVQFNRLAPPVVIENATIENRQAANFQSAIRDPQFAIELLPGENNLEINYTGLSFIKPEQIRFRYKLEGLNENWIDAGTRRAAFYPYLPPGEYRFRVAAANSDNVWNETGAALRIRVLPPFYRTWWFFGAALSSVGAMLFLIFRARLNRVERARRAQEEFSRRLIVAHEAERRRIAAELHDSIGQSLAMIKNRAVFAARAVADQAAQEQLRAITDQTAQAIVEVREISYNLRPYLLERLGLVRALKSLINKVEETHLLKIELRLDDVDDLFDSEAETSIYRIVQESLNNVARHAETERARLTIENSNGAIAIIIEDDGRGFDKTAQPSREAKIGGFGLLGIAERVRMLGGSLDIQSAPNAGTRLTIKIRANNENRINTEQTRNG